jgi:hypothetical protein
MKIIAIIAVALALGAFAIPQSAFADGSSCNGCAVQQPDSPSPPTTPEDAGSCSGCALPTRLNGLRMAVVTVVAAPSTSLTRRSLCRRRKMVVALAAPRLRFIASARRSVRSLWRAPRLSAEIV